MKNKHLKAPVLSTGFSENEKSAKKRFSNILNKKGSVGVAVVIILIVLVIIVGAFISINNKTNVISSNVSGDTKNSGEKEQTETINVEKQIDVIMNNIDTWNLSTDEDIYAPYGYAITDLDQNGRLEIIASSCQGTGIYTYSNYYEVNESLNGLNKIERNVEEGSSEADIMIPTVKVFINKATNEYHYIFDDLVKVGAAEYYENKQDIVLKNGKIYEKAIAYRNTVYTDSNPNVTLKDANNKEITAEDYALIENKLFSNLELKFANIEWVSTTDVDFSSVSGDELKNKLIESYEKFGFSDIEVDNTLDEEFSLIDTNNIKVILKDDITNFKKEPVKSEFDKGDGYMWRTYTYDDITVTALLNTFVGKYYINKIETTSPNYKTPKGIGVGDKLEKLQGTYISDLSRINTEEIQNIVYQYKEPSKSDDNLLGAEMNFYIKDGKITKIEMIYIFD
jgi:hypothetical protein